MQNLRNTPGNFLINYYSDLPTFRPSDLQTFRPSDLRPSDYMKEHVYIQTNYITFAA